ncbi:MAG: hypothetical protein WC755_05445 [Candidatus Woesearchaeota archaeon]|jgi:hypothetical protein
MIQNSYFDVTISNERINHIDNLVEDIKSKYGSFNLENLEQAAQDNEITIIKDDRINIPSLEYRNGWYLLTKKNIPQDEKTQRVMTYGFARAICHAMLNHKDEPKNDSSIEERMSKRDIIEDILTENERKELRKKEADYFQEKLGYKEPTKIEIAYALLSMRKTIKDKLKIIFSEYIPGFSAYDNSQIITEVTGK